MAGWSLSRLLGGLHDDIEQRLRTTRQTFGHPGTKGDASEAVWLQLLQNYLPKRYAAASAHVVDSAGTFSDQIDVVVFDRQYSPFIFHFEGQKIIPAEASMPRSRRSNPSTPSRLPMRRRRSPASGSFIALAYRSRMPAAIIRLSRRRTFLAAY